MNLQSKYIIPVEFLDQAWKIREDADPVASGEVGYLTRVFTLAGLPHTDPGLDNASWMRRNGKFCLTITPHQYINEDGEVVSLGVPYGSYPRLILLYICRQVVLTGNQRVTFGKSMSSFMKELGLSVTGGKKGTIHLLKDQLRRLLNANISFTFDGKSATSRGEIVAHRPIAENVFLWWSTAENPDQGALFESCVDLSDAFFKEILTHPIPLHMQAIRMFRKSPMALDLYTWLVYRIMGLSKRQFISWKALQAQVGADYSDTRDFKKRGWNYLQKITLAWEGLKIDKGTGGFYLNPAPTHIPRKIQNPDRR